MNQEPPVSRGSFDPTFPHFARLLQILASIPPRPASEAKPRHPEKEKKSRKVIRGWISSLRQPLPPKTGVILFRLLFPEEDVRRKYDIQEARLAKLLPEVLGVTADGLGARGSRLVNWAGGGSLMARSVSGCLGHEVEHIMESTVTPPESNVPTLEEVDSLLDELASHSAYSKSSQDSSKPRRSKKAILRDLYRHLSPWGAACMTQIILKDLRPLYRLPSTSTTAALLKYNSNAFDRLSKWEVMKEWHSSMPRMYRLIGNFDEAATVMENLDLAGTSPCVKDLWIPKLGAPVEIPKCTKGRSIAHVLSELKGSMKVWAETKYDGERMQIHIDLSKPEKHQVQVFSKSKRDSTLDRIATHPIIRAALALPPCDSGAHYPELLTARLSGQHDERQSSVKTSIILDAEMVTYSEEIDSIDEFWRIRSLIETTALSARRRFRPVPKDGTPSQEHIGHSLESDASAGGTRHFMVVFFDILLLNGVSLVKQSYEDRRRMLESVVTVIPGFTALAERTEIDMRVNPLEALENCFADSVADHQEGLVIKAAEAAYSAYKLPWVKLKKDYIPGFGDSVDLAVIGATWDKDRGRELGVSPDTYTTYFIGALGKSGEEQGVGRPHIQCLFTVSYILDRPGLEELNYRTKKNGCTPSSENLQKLPYTFDLPAHCPKPRILLRQPMLFEILGAGFTKPRGAKYYELRFPRATKVWREQDRSWIEALTVDKFQEIAREAIGRDTTDKELSDKVAQMWGRPPSPGAKCPLKRRHTSAAVFERLQQAEGGSAWERPSARGADRKSKSDSALPLATAEFPAKRMRVTASSLAGSRTAGDQGKGSSRGNPISTLVLACSVTRDQVRTPRQELQSSQSAPSLPITAAPEGAIVSTPRLSPRVLVFGSPDDIPTTTALPLQIELLQPRADLLRSHDEAPHIDLTTDNALIYVARAPPPSQPTQAQVPAPRPEGRPLIKDLVPPERRVSSLDALFIGIRWVPSSQLRLSESDKPRPSTFSSHKPAPTPTTSNVNSSASTHGSSAFRRGVIIIDASLSTQLISMLEKRIEEMGVPSYPVHVFTLDQLYYPYSHLSHPSHPSHFDSLCLDDRDTSVSSSPADVLLPIWRTDV
ncbi:hypothetical protein BOTBODRAFT_28144 [Botryobasidium botryosum FD-172 SS1]|uniref:ATP-dependent DNA ligase family profile domain-containing protein n=1 Tax=Botryobasidium botryosum (strain FD-172 SS1) TaxID=930990 RepID=A0A067MVC9_BOTB1|nr:hypothetical protein BOTBODRAFT_28144 [Botryobasidium botryosum FD-172 SS1]